MTNSSAKHIKWILSILLISLLACGLSDLGLGLPTVKLSQDQLQTAAVMDELHTAQVQTLVAQVQAGTQPAVAPTQVIQPGQTTTQSGDTLAPTITLAISQVVSSPFPSAVPGELRVSVSKQTICRSGPSKVYEQLGVLDPGELAEVLGQDPPKLSWYIRLPKNPSIMCWVWGEFATLTGSATAVPVFTAMPSPSPAFTATLPIDYSLKFIGLSYCIAPAGYYYRFEIVNTGSLTWQSIDAFVKDTVTLTEGHNLYNAFYDGVGCVFGPEQKDITSGEVGAMISTLFPLNPAGHLSNASIKICSENGLTGTCITKNLIFTP